MDKLKNIDDFWLCLGRANKHRTATLQKIYAQNYTHDKLSRLKETDLVSIGIPAKEARSIIETIESSDINKIKNELANNHIKYSFIYSADYPRLLKEISCPPFILYYKGNLEIASSQLAIAVVGSRKTTEYGQNVTRDIVSDLARIGTVIVSGMALGVDSIAHNAALDARGQTIAVLGCGLDQVYPSSNLGLSKKILDQGGLIISEYPFGTPPLKPNFPARNRIISGLSNGLLVAEAAIGSGSLITANFALEQNRDIFAIPGSIYSFGSQGTNNLIKNGARLVSAADDIFDEYGIYEKVATEKIAIVADNPTEEKILSILSREPLHIDVITKDTGLSGPTVSSALTIMEITGKVKHLGGQCYRINY